MRIFASDGTRGPWERGGRGRGMIERKEGKKSQERVKTAQDKHGKVLFQKQ